MVITTASKIKSSPAGPTPESGNINRVKWVYGGGSGAAAAEVRKANINHYEDYEMRRKREAEKAEKLINIICWGPK